MSSSLTLSLPTHAELRSLYSYLSYRTPCSGYQNGTVSHIYKLFLFQEAIRNENPPLDPENEELESRGGHRLTWRRYHRYKGQCPSCYIVIQLHAYICLGTASFRYATFTALLTVTRGAKFAIYIQEPPWVQTLGTIHGGRSGSGEGFSPRFFSSTLLIIIPVLLRTHLSLSTEACDSSDLVFKLGASSLTQHLLFYITV
jgi:hypothetical protein